MTIALSDQQIIDSELRDLGGVPAMMLFSGEKRIGVGPSLGNEVAVARNADGIRGASAEVETVFLMCIRAHVIWSVKAQL